MRVFEAAVATETSYELAEGPCWDAARGQVLWVDIEGGLVLRGRLTGDHVEVLEQHRFTGTVAAAVPTVDGGLLVTLRRGFAAISPDGTVRPGVTVLCESDDSRLNDGACDPRGRFLIGSMSLDDRTGAEKLYRLDSAGAVEAVDDGLTLANGLGWSPDGHTMYLVDSIPGVVWARDYDPASGAMGPRRLLLRFDDGLPDGLCVDSAGNLWVAVHGAGQVRCFDADGGPVATVNVPAPHTTSVAFVGPARDRLLITSGRAGVSAAQLAAHPLSGRLFLADVGVTGVETAPWAGRCADVTAP